jgi:hypothetical protein
MNKSFFYISILAMFLFLSCQDENTEQICEGLNDEVFGWLPNQKGDTVKISIENDSIPYKVIQNEYFYDPEKAVGMGFGSVCVNDWSCILENDDTQISFSVSDNDFKKTTIFINGEKLTFYRVVTNPTAELMEFSNSNINDSSRIESITFMYDYGIKTISLKD